MGEPTEPTWQSPVQDRQDRGSVLRRCSRWLRLRLRRPARKPYVEEWWPHSQPDPPSVLLHWRVLLMLGGVAAACGIVSLATLGLDSPGVWELALRLGAAALAVTALVICIMGFLRRHPRRGILSSMFLAIAALVVGIAVAALAEWVSE
jgi:hypothetical protein